MLSTSESVSSAASETAKGLLCGICIEVPWPPVESACCGHVFCADCLAKLHASSRANGHSPKCPFCRATPVAAHPSKALARMLGSIVAPCVFCAERVPAKHRETHKKTVCPRAPKDAACPKPACSFRAVGPESPEMLLHLVSAHAGDLLQATAALYRTRALEPIRDEFAKDKDPTMPRVNAKGHLARLGETGSYYCGQPLDRRCYCCNGYCGPTNGVNCDACFDLDFVVKGLPEGFRLNGNGVVCRLDPRSGSDGNGGVYYCGRKLSMHSENYCAASSAKQCRACKRLNKNPNNLRRHDFQDDDGDDNDDDEDGSDEDDDE
ncbi:hypothetical protein BC830DRAFT_1169948 [Chytriomyces sp. MP71]|nr:hypothetical protein BC830DRAFT_1169948 [Chytriomyces sp. MP71]